MPNMQPKYFKTLFLKITTSKKLYPKIIQKSFYFFYSHTDQFLVAIKVHGVKISILKIKNSYC